MPLRIAITTLGCKVNRADADQLLSRLGDLQPVQVPFDRPADVYIINSCTVTGTADRQSRQLVHRARRASPTARVYLTGCLAALERGSVGLDGELDGVYPLARHGELVAQIRAIARTGSGREGLALEPRARPFVKVQDGCDEACRYCIVPVVRGPSRSTRMPGEIRAALAVLAGRGFHEAVLTGIHLGRYGLDLDPPWSLTGLLASLVEPPVVHRLRLSSLEPLEIEPGLVELLATHPDRLCPHLHVPIQSGDDGVLAAMGRPYRVAQIHDLLHQLRRRLPDAALGTDLIAGYPGETEAQHRASLELVETSTLTHLHVFPYSRRPGTPAAELSQLDGGTIRNRARALRRAGRERLRAFAEGQLGRVREVLVERQLDKKVLLALTDNYVRVRLEGPAEWIRRPVPVELCELEPGAEVVVRGRAV